MTGSASARSYASFLDNYADDIARQLRVKKMDNDHFYAVVSGVNSRKVELDQMIVCGSIRRDGQ